jgi:caa(3)-type oxidase subunit IV
MSDHAHAAEGHHGPSYLKIWALLLVLLVVSVAGPMLEVKIITLITAFGIAIVKAYLVAKHFMHINLEQRYVTYFMVTTLVFILLFFAATAPDVMKPDGRNWEKPSWKVPVAATTGGEHGGEHGGAH